MKVIKPIGLNTDGSFSRASIGTYFDESKQLKVASINEPRFNYNTETGLFEGLLLEPSSSNLITYSENVGDSSWTKQDITVSENSSAAPDGTLTADSIIADDSVAFILKFAHISPDSLNDYYATAFVKKGTSSIVTFNVYHSGNSEDNVTFNLDTLEVSGEPYTGEYTFQNCGNGWYRIGYRISRDSSGISEYIDFRIWPNSRTTLQNGDSIFVWGMQLEQRSSPTSYIPTSTSTVTRAADVVTGSGLIYTDLVNTYANWDSGTTYSIGQSVTYGHRYYESVQNSNTNKQPDTNPNFWLDVGPDNKHASIDNSVSTVSSKVQEFTIVFKPNTAFDSFALINTDANITEVAITNMANVIYTKKFGLSVTEVFDWYQYFFYDTIDKRTQIVETGLSAQSSSVITIRVKTSESEIASVGQIVIGTTTDIGLVQYGANSGIVDFSVKETDEFGNMTFIERPYSDRMSAEVVVRTVDLNRVKRLLRQLRATPSVWIGSEDPDFEETLIVFGFYRDFSITIAYPTYSLCSIEIEGLT